MIYVTGDLEPSSWMSSNRPPNGDTKVNKQSCKYIFFKNSKTLKNVILGGDLNINGLDYEENKKSKIKSHKFL